MNLLSATFLAAALALQPPALPAPTGLVSDFADVIGAEDEARITQVLEAVRTASGGEIAVVTLRDLAGRDPAEVALRIGREWGVGAAAEVGEARRNAGVVILLVPKETSADGSGYIRIETGQGAEGFIPDAVTGDITREATPLLAQGAYGPALKLIADRVAQRYAAEFGFALDSQLVSRRPAGRQRGIPPVLVLLAFFLLLNVLQGRRRRGGVVFVPFPVGRGGFGGGFGGGGFGGGGFGGFGGGGGFSGGGGGGRF